MTAPQDADTGRAFSRAAWRRAHKALFRSGCALLGVEYPAVAAVCDENVSTVKAWADPHRDHAVPQWAWRRVAQQLPALAAFVDAGMRAHEERAARAGGDADAHALPTIAQLSAAVAALAEIAPNGITAAEARDRIDELCAARAQLDAQIAALCRRAGVVPATPEAAS